MAKNLARSIYESQDKPIEGIIIGTIPEWINGTLFRNGPGRFRFGEKIYNHLFDGMAVVNKFQISNGKVYFTNKILETNSLEKTIKTNKLAPMFGTTDPCSKFFDRFKVQFKSILENDNVNVNVLPFANNQLYALTESSMVVRLDPKNLNVLSRANLVEYIKPTITTIAHPQIEDDGSWISVGMQPKGINMSYDVMKFQAKDVENACESLKLFAQIPSSHKFGLSYFHSIGLSKNYIIFLEQSLVVDVKKVLWNIVTNKPISTTLKMNKKFQTQIHLVDRKTGKILPQKFFTDPQFSFHHINAFETNEDDASKNELLIDICSYSVDSLYIESFNYDENDEEQVLKFFEKSKAEPRRIRVPLGQKKARNEAIYCEIKNMTNGISMELPTINYFKYNAKHYNYAYGLGSIKPPFSVIKLNVNNYNDYKQAVIKTDNRVMVLSEPVFVERPDAQSEDDGVVLTMVLGDKYDSLIVLDAKTLEEIGRAELPEEVRATFTLHGFFADNKGFKDLN
jgi:carotenoid cleavage dioxygenase-like enzyme